MATTSFLYHPLALRGYVHLSTEYRWGSVFHHVERAAGKRRCRACGAGWRRLSPRGGFRRSFLALPVGRRKQYVVLHGRRVHCSGCGKTQREAVDLAKGKRRYLKAFARYVLELCRIAPLKAVARLLGMGWDLVKQIHKEHLGRRLKGRKLGRLRWRPWTSSPSAAATAT